MRTSTYRIFYLAAAAAILVAPMYVLADEEPDESADEATEVEERRTDEAALIEDPEAQRRARALAARELAAGDTEELDEFEPGGSLELYGSARVHAINNYEVDTGKHTAKVGDGNSRVGARAEWQFESDWNLIGRGEFGFNALDSFSTRGNQYDDDNVDVRLAYLALGHKNLTFAAGKNWSVYYSVANVTDRFAIFGGSASGIYNASTAGDKTGTGRASDVIQARVNIGPREKGLFKNLKPFNVNVQYQLGQDIPFATGEKYDYSYAVSTFLESNNEFALGIAYNLARVPEGRTAIEGVGIDGDATALAITTRAYGNRWYVGLLVSRLENMETTNEGRYFDGNGAELYAQWEFREDWWLIGGANVLEPDDDDPDAGMYRVRYGVLGGRYSIDSFERMIYIEYRFDEGRQFDGSTNKDELTIGIRWDFGE